MEPGEPSLVALQRELREELGVVVEQGDLSEVPDFRQTDEAFDGSAWKVGRWAGSPTNLAPDEHDEIRWFDIEAALRLPLPDPWYPSMLRTLFSLDLPVGDGRVRAHLGAV